MALNIFPIYKEEISNEFLICPLRHPLLNYKWSKMSITFEDGRSYDIPTIGEISEDVPTSSIIYLRGSPVGFKDSNNNIVTQVLLHESNINREPYKSIKKCLTEEKASDLEQFVKKLEDDEFSNKVIRYIFERDKSKFRGTGFENNIDNLLKQLLENKDKLIKNFPHLKFIINALKAAD